MSAVVRSDGVDAFLQVVGLKEAEYRGQRDDDHSKKRAELVTSGVGDEELHVVHRRYLILGSRR